MFLCVQSCIHDCMHLYVHAHHTCAYTFFSPLPRLTRGRSGKEPRGCRIAGNLSGAGAELFQIRCFARALPLGLVVSGESIYTTLMTRSASDTKKKQTKKKQPNKKKHKNPKHLLGLLGQELFNREGPGGVKVAWKSGGAWGSASARSSVEQR